MHALYHITYMLSLAILKFADRTGALCMELLAVALALRVQRTCPMPCPRLQTKSSQIPALRTPNQQHHTVASVPALVCPAPPPTHFTGTAKPPS
jgi:hypothetical protein